MSPQRRGVPCTPRQHVRPAPPERLSRAGTVAFIRRACLSHNHPVGTCAMGSGREAVVDAGLQARGVEGLRIADASVMPSPAGCRRRDAEGALDDYRRYRVVRRDTEPRNSTGRMR
jgi:GMC oxidoreductase